MVGPSAATHKNHVWAWDFIHERTEDGRPLKCLSIVDEHTRLGVALEIRRSIKNSDVASILRETIVRHGAPNKNRNQETNLQKDLNTTEHFSI